MNEIYEEMKIDEEFLDFDAKAPRPNGACQTCPPYDPCKPPDE